MIFKTYTGNAMLNNALMTIEALSKVNHVSEITPNLIFDLYQKIELKNLNQRLKSYTMLFTKNGPLKNDIRNGEKIYEAMFKYFTQNIETDGDKQCEISGLRYSKTFNQLFEEVLKDIGLSKAEIEKKDTTINRTWFPLIGGLGSDAQALPQAKFAVRIHPIIIPILQFLPLSTVLYKGGVLIVDSSNFEFTREFIAQNVKDVRRRIETTEANNPIENLKNFAKGNYLLRAIKILEEKSFDENYTELNLWSFSNSGTGASCEIERVPNKLIKKIVNLDKNPNVQPELRKILANQNLAYHFIEALENNQEWYGLYPNVYGSGKNKIESEGVSVPFFEAYFKEIRSAQKIAYAKYIAYLVDKYKSDSLSKYITKKDAWNDTNFRIDLYAVLVKATENKEWDLLHQLNILDDSESVPIKNSFYNILKITHFYHYKSTCSDQLPIASQSDSSTKKVLEWLIALIQVDNRKETLIKNITNPQTYLNTNFTNLIYRSSHNEEVDLATVYYVFYNEQFKSIRYGINELLRLFFSQTNQPTLNLTFLEKKQDWQLSKSTAIWFQQFDQFALDYQKYYFNKYGNPETGEMPIRKFFGLIDSIPENSSQYLNWFYEALENTNRFLFAQAHVKEKWNDKLLFAPNQEFSQAFSRMALKFSLLKSCHSYKQLTLNTLIN